MLNEIYSAAINASKSATTMIKSMAVAFGDTPDNDRQYLFCDDYMVCPIYTDGQREVDITLFEDGYIDIYNGKCYGSGNHTVAAPVDRLPVFIRPGSVLPLRLDKDTLLPTLDESRLIDVLGLTAPTFERSKVYYKGVDESVTFNSTPTDNGFVLKCDCPCDTKQLIVYGTVDIEVFSDAEVESVKYDEENNRTVISLGDSFNEITINFKR